MRGCASGNLWPSLNITTSEPPHGAKGMLQVRCSQGGDGPPIELVSERPGTLAKNDRVAAGAPGELPVDHEDIHGAVADLQHRRAGTDRVRAVWVEGAAPVHSRGVARAVQSEAADAAHAVFAGQAGRPAVRMHGRHASGGVRQFQSPRDSPTSHRLIGTPAQEPADPTRCTAEPHCGSDPSARTPLCAAPEDQRVRRQLRQQKRCRASRWVAVEDEREHTKGGRSGWWVGGWCVWSTCGGAGTGDSYERLPDLEGVSLPTGVSGPSSAGGARPVLLRVLRWVLRIGSRCVS